MKVAYLLPGMDLGGVEQGTFDLAKGLIGKGHSVVIISEEGRFIPELKKIGVKHYPLKIGSKNPFLFPFLKKKLRDIIKKEEPDIIHCRSRIPAIFGYYVSKDFPNTHLITSFLTSFFSGGWRMRIELAKLLLKKPDFLLLDEPTNHLDIESIQWLENYLKDYHGGVILISHDRASLDNVTTRTVELLLGKIYDYKAPFSQFVILRRERMETQLAAYRNQQKKIADTNEFIDRFRYKATKAVQVQSRIKHLDKIERIELESEDRSAISIKFPPAPRAGSIVVEAASLSKSYGTNLVLDEIDIIIERGEKVAFVGKNGEGKTTFARVLMGELEFSGNLKIGYNVITGYFAQTQDELMDGNKTVFKTIDDIATGSIRTRIRDILGAFLFSGEEIDKKVKVLSGGERSRLALVKLLLEPYNLLIMDEPTNHLDMRSKDILKEALLKYDGTLIIVSHDREFLDGLTNKVFEFSNRKIKESIGGIYDFLRRKKIESLRELEIKRTGINTLQKKETSNKKKYIRRKEYEKNLRKLERRVSKLESEIDILEKEIAEMDRIIASPKEFANYNSGKGFFIEYEKLKEKLSLKLKEWEECSADIEKRIVIFRKITD